MISKVSVIIPCYNGKTVIDRSIESVYLQDYPQIELIVVDDGSTDDSKSNILFWKSLFEEKGFLLKYVYQNNRGLGGAIDTGLKYVTGEYLTLLDADDYFLANSISKRAKFLNEKKEYVGVRSNGWMMRNNRKDLFVTCDGEKEIIDLFEGLIGGRTNNWAGSYMIRTDELFKFYPERNIYPSRFGQNMQILLPVAYKNKFGYIDEPLMVYVVHENSLSQAYSKDEQYEKEEENQKGYRDIYLHMLDLIIDDATEHKKYCDIFNASYFRCAMLRAEKYGKFGQLEQSYRALKQTGLVTLNDKICYYNAKKSVMSYVYRALRKVNGLILR